MKLINTFYSITLYLLCFYLVFNSSKPWLLDVNIEFKFIILYFIAYFILISATSSVIVIVIKEIFSLIYNKIK